jgi:hypothetical protein
MAHLFQHTGRRCLRGSIQTSPIIRIIARLADRLYRGFQARHRIQIVQRTYRSLSEWDPIAGNVLNGAISTDFRDDLTGYLHNDGTENQKSACVFVGLASETPAFGGAVSAWASIKYAHNHYYVISLFSFSDTNPLLAHNREPAWRPTMMINPVYSASCTHTLK